MKTIKPLPPPIDPGRKKRGGRQHRKLKERLGMTQLRSQSNQMKFEEVSYFHFSLRFFFFNFDRFLFKIEEDAYQDAIGFSTGMIGKSGSGKIRRAQVDSKTKAKISQKLQVGSLFLFVRMNFFFIYHIDLFFFLV